MKMEIKQESKKYIFKDQVNPKLEKGEEVIMMMGGGIASIGVFYHLLKFFTPFKIVFFENRFDNETNKLLNDERKRAVYETLLMSKNKFGKSLIQLNQQTQEIESWLSDEFTFPLAKLEDTDKRKDVISDDMLFMINQVIQQLKHIRMFRFYWGTYHEKIVPLLEQHCKKFSNLQISHYFPLSTEKRALFSLISGETDGKTMNSLYSCYYQLNSLSCCLPNNISNIACSCHNPTFSSPKTLNQITFSKPFYACCQQCFGCKRYIEAFQELKQSMPLIRIGKIGKNGPGDDRKLINVPYKQYQADSKARKKNLEFAIVGGHIESEYSEYEKKKEKENKALEEQQREQDESDNDDQENDFFGETSSSSEDENEDEDNSQNDNNYEDEDAENSAASNNPSDDDMDF